MITIDLSILNQKGTPMFYSDIFADRPPFGIAGRIFISTDTKEFYRDTGTSWELLAGPGGGTITGSGTATQVAFFNSSSSITGNNDLWWDNSNSRLGIGNNNPASNLDIHGNNATIQIDGRSTSSAFVQFVTQGVLKWRIGNLSPSNYFQIYDNDNSLERVKLENTGLFTLTGKINNNETTTAVFNDGWYGVYSNEDITINAGQTFTGGNSFGSLVGRNLMRYQGNATFPNAAVPASILGTNVFNFPNAGSTITITQGTGVRAFSAINAFNQLNSVNSGTITHIAGLHVLAPYRATGGVDLTCTNYYGLLINASNERTAFTITNAWGIYQEGSSDKNYLNGTTLIGTNVDTLSGAKLQVNGAATFSGNVGIGVNPSAWGSNAKALQFSGGSLWNFTSSYLFLSQNAYFDNSNQIYINSAAASDYYQFNGQHVWRTAPSGTAGNAITFTQAMTLDASGRLGIGTPTPSYRLHINSNDGVIALNGYTYGGTVSEHTYSKAAGFFIDSYQSVAGGTFTKTTDIVANADAGADSQMRFFTATSAGNPTERMRITSSGRTLIGTTTDNTVDLLQVAGSARFKSTGNYNSISIDNNSTTGGGGAYFLQNGTTGGGIGVSGWYLGDTSNDLFVVSETNRNIRFATNAGSERMRITSGGNVKINNQLGVGKDVSGNYPLTLQAASSDTIFQGFSSNGTYQMDCYEDGTSGEFHMRNGSRDVYLARTAGTWVGNSDKTIKENITIIDNSLNKLMQLNGYYYNLIDDKNKNKRVGVIAQEVQKVLPEATHLSYSKTYEREIMGVEYDVLIPLLINSIKEQQAQIEELKTELDTLKK